MDAVTGFFAQQSPVVLWGLGGVLAVLTLAVGITALLPVLKPASDFTNLRQRIASWWVMIALLAGALLLGWQAFTALMIVISFIALREFLSLAPVRREDRLIVLAAFVAMGINYLFIILDDYGLYRVFIPTYVFLIIPFLMACIGQTRAFLSTTATFHWAIVTCVYNLGYIAFLMRTPAAEAQPAGAAGLVFFLLVVTEANDVAQYVWGKLFGKRKIVPKVSPNKTWEGFIGGWATTSALIWFLGPVFTPLSGIGLACLALFLPLAGFAGDVTMSAIKRDIGVKDTSALIPGHGGLLDRADSLTFTAPLYFHILAYFALDHF
ncbi:phosphatidate cytidylyltransferase [Phenylobacterium haematophilum]|uniref:Phosphatidate cytidylyltransferase n=1 Tax=Phenylobacterium haematophilum TaxID=98513 RepID=A0A839ZYS3_9CAUL|nr:phosphatidate cytidylyltransferase [Phenylobacterium haematophilum]MBB3891735.1 phosphatidate cytidylyltransferase [Phenylobacterium haematophilum]